MKDKTKAILRSVLLSWGAISLVGVLGVAAFISYKLGPGNRNRIDTASSEDVRYVLNWCGLGEKRIEKVLRSHVSARSLTGDHLDAYAIRISHVDESEFTSRSGDAERHWYRGDELPPVLVDATTFAEGWSHYIPWFPSERELRSPDFYVYPWTIQYHGGAVTAAELIFVRPSDKMLFFFGGKT